MSNRHELRDERLHNKGDRIYKRSRANRDALAEILAETLDLTPITLPGLSTFPRRTIAAVAVDTANDTGWFEAALSDCEHGCKVYERIHHGHTERRVIHNRVYGCRKDQTVTPTPAPVIDTVIVKHRIRTTPSVADPYYREFMRNPGINDHEVYTPPTLMQLARRAR